MRNLRVLVICRPDQLPPDSLEGLSEKEIYACKTEWDVFTTLRASGHEVQGLGMQSRKKPCRTGLPSSISIRA